MKNQRGDAIIEALIAVVLLGVIAVGLTLALSKSAVGQRNMNVRNLAVGAVRNDMSSAADASGCTNGTTSNVNVSLALTSGQTATAAKSCTLTPVTVTVGGVTVNTLAPVTTYSVTSTSLLGADTLQVQN